jgi:putative two-component system response regulator
MMDKANILVVDDEEPNRRLMRALLEPLGYSVAAAADGQEALEAVRANPPDIVLMDALMPRMGGLEATRQLKASEETRIIPVIMITGLRDLDDKVSAFQAGADDFLTKPFERVELQARIASLLKVKAYNEQKRRYEKELEAEVERRTRQLKETHARLRTSSLEMVYRLSRAAEFRDEDTGVHLKRMSQYSAALARHLGLSERTVDAIVYAAPMHDVGKIGIPDSILLKPARLDRREMEIMRLHTTIGVQILHGSTEGFLKLGEVIALTHHERWNGRGYPRGLSRTQVPLVGYITSIADVFDALISKRPYKEAYSIERSLAIIRAGRETRFHPDVADAFFEILDQILAIRDKHVDSREDEGALFRLARMAKDNGNISEKKPEVSGPALAL